MEIDLHGATGALNIDDAHRDVVLAPGEPICPYTPEHEVNVAFLGSAMPGDFALGEFFGPMKEESDALSFAILLALAGSDLLRANMRETCLPDHGS